MRDCNRVLNFSLYGQHGDRTKDVMDTPPKELLFLGRYMDDIVGIWAGTEEETKNLLERTADENVRLTFVFGRRSIEALDITISLEDNGRCSGKLYDPFRPPTDGTLYIHWQ